MFLLSGSFLVVAAFALVAAAEAQGGGGGRGGGGAAQSARGAQPPPRQLLPASEITLLRTTAELQARVAQQPCVPGGAPAGRGGTARTDTIRITTESGYPCTIATAPTGIELRGSDDGSHPDPRWTSVARDGRGRYVTAARQGAVALSYNANGSFNAVFGRAGRGPGEFVNTPVPLRGAGRYDLRISERSCERLHAAAGLRS